jgi:uncharacterized protein YkwD
MDDNARFSFFIASACLLFLAACGGIIGGGKTTGQIPAAPPVPTVTLAPTNPPPTPAPPTEPPVPVTIEVPTVEVPTYEPVVLALIAALNEWRISTGLWPLRPNKMLEQMAVAQAEYVLSLPEIPDGGEIHTGPGGENPRQRAVEYGWPYYGTSDRVAVTEIAYVGAGEDAALLFWESSPIHRQSALSAAYREVGVAALPHPYGFLYIVVLGARPNVLPVLIDPVESQLYLSTERYEYAATGGGIQEVVQVQVLPSAEGPVDDAAWTPWALTLPAPEGLGVPFYVVYSDGINQLITEVNPAVDVAWLPSNLP